MFPHAIFYLYFNEELGIWGNVSLVEISGKNHNFFFLKNDTMIIENKICQNNYIDTGEYNIWLYIIKRTYISEL